MIAKETVSFYSFGVINGLVYVTKWIQLKGGLGCLQTGSVGSD